MKTDEGDEIIEPGTYDLGEDQRLHVFLIKSSDEVQMWACAAYDHGPLCRLCQRVEGTLNALLVNVIDGRMTCRQKLDGEFEFKLTQAGFDAVHTMLKRNGEETG